MFTLAISCLTTSNLPWFTGLTFQVPLQYCSLQHQTLLPSPVTSTTGYCFCFGSILSILSGVIFPLISSRIWAPTDLGSSSFSALSFCLFILFMGFSRREYWSGFHFLPQWTTFCQNSPPWPIILGWPYRAWLIVSLSLDKAVVCVIRLLSFLWSWFSVCLNQVSLWSRRIRGLWKLPDGRDWLRGYWVLFWWVGPCSANL